MSELGMRATGSRKGKLREYAEAFGVALIIALVVRTLLLQAFKIPSGSMEDTLLIGDHIFVNKFVYGYHVPYTKGRILAFTTPKRGDIVVFVFPVRETRVLLRKRSPVDVDRLLPDLHDVPRGSYYTLDEILARVLGKDEDDDVAPFRCGEGQDPALRVRYMVPVDELVDEDVVPDQERVLHAARRDLERLQEEGADDQGDDEGDAERLSVLPDLPLLGARCANPKFRHHLPLSSGHSINTATHLEDSTECARNRRSRRRRGGGVR